ncbi:hypothetical protein AB4Y85_01910 [Microvirga sp. 2YAF29]|uniref:hypothetical protein n=1 Tax=Microvirga sp. 2YAF29 TaxID=3233031 RepID=UPI003F9A782F
MRINSPAASRVSALVLMILIGVGVTACAGETVRNVATSVGAGPTTAPSPDFVANSRPQSLDYMPIGGAVDGRPTAARTADEVKKAEAELDAMRARNEAAGAAAARLGGTPPPEPLPAPVRRPQKSR